MIRKTGLESSIESSARPGKVTSVAHAMQIMEMLVNGGEVSVTQVAARLDVAASTASRLLATIADHGFAEQLPSRRYQLGRGFRPAPLDPATRLAARLAPVIRSLYGVVEETVHLMMLVGGDIVFIDGIESQQELRVGLRVGARMPAYCNSGGKAILADLGPGAAQQVYPHGLPGWPTQRLHTFEELERELDEVRALGVAYNRGESEAGVRALGVAIPGAHGHPAAAMAVSIPEARFVAPEAARFVRALQDARSHGERALVTS